MVRTLISSSGHRVHALDTPPRAYSDAVNAVRLEGVTFVRAGRELLHGIDLTVGRGEQWALLGPNGAGKSTLLSICSATTFPSRGSARILDAQMGRVDLRELRRSIAVVDARHPLRSNLTVLDIVLTGATSTIERVPRWEPTDDQRKRAEDLMSQLGVGDDSTQRWLTMSQGERGRTLIARALMTDPELLILDEPSTGLDLAARERMIATIDRLPETGVTTIMVTHHFEELPTRTTHAALVRAGRLVAAGPVDQVLTDANVSAAFDHPVRIERIGGRWSARTRTS
ncbi:ATP-binding cassette domain-containing protein [Aeromicrobium phragmitis]|uniref:ATP-binding cassette domain-containing protein n=1 Tax=Aeromicrobium phragmitis TaxID=2478914 RepID=A0A3L8PJS5_9ACTN|nr:ATP-binding cassette domain-containing protein [Aeromicrobium phragmitis]